VIVGGFPLSTDILLRFAGVLRVPEVGLEPTRCSRTTGF
jgi:hypothetical protein